MTATPLSLTDDLIEQQLLPYGVPIDQELCERIRIYVAFLLQWNSKISLTAITDPAEILRVHFGESFFAAAVAGIGKGRVADIGTGAGFPGIPIRMVSPLVDLTLVEPVLKKAVFLREVVRRLGFTDVNIIRCRMDEIPPNLEVDFVTARALGKYSDLLSWAKSRLSRNGKLVLLLGKAEAERLMQEKGWQWGDTARIPETKGRFVVVGEVVGNS
jgi:16S rRNA (guanine527-N7)-methyltransferase